MNKIKSLEGLRGIAAFVVVIFHFFTIFYPALVNATPNQVKTYNGIELIIATTPLNVLYNGNFAVYIFFVLSGFVLTYKFFNTGETQVITASAYKRYFRLVIPVAFSVLCFYILQNFNIPTAKRIEDPNLLDALKEGFIGAFLFKSTTYNPVLWTIHYEFLGSFMVFGICLIFGKSEKRFCVYAVLALISLNTNFLSFILGMVLSDIWSVHKQFIKSKITNCALLGIALFLGSFPHKIGKIEGSINIDSTIYKFMDFQNAGTIYHTIGAALLLIVLLNSKTFKNILSKGVFQFLGKVSFSMYVIHFAVLRYFSLFFYHFVADRFPLLTHKYKFLITFFVSMIIIFAISIVMEKYIDKPGVKFSNFLYNKFFSGSKSEKKPIAPQDETEIMRG